MSYNSSISTGRTPSVPSVAATDTTSSQFWVAPSRKIVWQRFLTTSSVAYPMHRHAEYNAVICLDGAVEVQQWGDRQIAETGEVIFGNASVPHASIYTPSARRCEVINLTLSADLVQKAVNEAYAKGSRKMEQPVFLGKLSSAAIRSLAVQVRDELYSTRGNNSERLHHLGRRMISEILRVHARPVSCEPRCTKLHELLPRWQYVKTHEFMLKSSKDVFSIPSIAHRLGISPGRFHLLFRSTTGVSPAKYFGDLVLERACTRLASTNDSVKEISYELGYCNPSHLCSVFKKHYGVSPLDFRRLSHHTQTQLVNGSNRNCADDPVSVL